MDIDERNMDLWGYGDISNLTHDVCHCSLCGEQDDDEDISEGSDESADGDDEDDDE